MRATVLGLVLYAFLIAQAAQAQQTCEPADSPRCRFIANCLKPAPPPKKGPGMRPTTQEGCSCIWGVLERAFPADEHALVADYFEALGSPEKTKAMFPDFDKHMEVVATILRALAAASKARECAP